MTDTVQIMLDRHAQQIEKQMQEHSNALDRMADSVAKLAECMVRSEMQHENSSQSIQAINNRVANHSSRLHKLEIEQAKRQPFFDIWTRMILTVAGLAAAGILTSTFITAG